ncbi:reverse transcriptase domain-containing protein [Tanacetum coccineum]
MGVKNLVAKVDSCLVAIQINGSYEAKEQSMIQYLEKAKALTDNFKMFSIKQLPRSENKKADALSKIASTSFAHLTKQVLVEILKGKSLEEREILAVVEEEGTRKDSGCQEKSYPITKSSSGTTHSKTGAKSSTSSKGSLPSKHPQTNGQVEKGNYSLGEGIKARLGEDKKNWVEEVLYVSWAHRTMIKTSNGDTPFSLTYSTKAVIPVEIEMPSLRCAKVNQAKNDEGLLLNLDILEERREKAAIREAKSKAKMEKYYNAKVHSTTFRPGDFIYRINEASYAKESGKLGPKWEGSYEVVEKLGKGAYMLRNESGDILPRTWNVKDLKKCYL